MSRKFVRAVDRYELFNAYTRVIMLQRERERDQARLTAAILLGKNICYMCNDFVDKPAKYCDQCMPF